MATYRNDGTFTVDMVDLYGKKVTLNPGDKIETHEVLRSPFTKTSDEPYYSPVLLKDEVEVPGSLLSVESCRIIKVTTGSYAVTMFFNSTSNEKSVYIPASTTVKIKNNGYIYDLYFTTEEAAGTDITVEGFAEEDEVPVFTEIVTTP